jgi:nucleotide-binding universal stress UspA family protein
VLATDFSREALRSVQYASSLAQDYNATLTVMNVLSHAITPEEQSRNELRSMRKLRELLASDCGDECTLQYQVRSGDLADAVIDAAQKSKASLIVLGARHRSALADHAPRNKLSAIIRSARCPVLVVPAHRS